MASIGMNVAADGRLTPASIAALHCTWVRLVARQEHDLSAYLASLQAVGIRVLLVFDRTSVEQFGMPATAFEFYDHHYGLLVDGYEVGNEPDIESPSSWSMTPAEFTALGRIARQTCPERLIVAGGMASGQPSYLTGQDIGWCDVVAVHPYGKSPSPDWPHPGWGTGYLGDLISAYAALGKPLWITEMGLSTDEVSEDFQAEYVDRLLQWAAPTSDVGAFFWFCFDDAQV